MPSGVCSWEQSSHRPTEASTSAFDPPRIAKLVLDREKLANMRVAARQSILEKNFSADRTLNAYKELLSVAASASCHTAF
jgi:hypothetical protein